MNILNALRVSLFLLLLCAVSSTALADDHIDLYDNITAITDEVTPGTNKLSSIDSAFGTRSSNYDARGNTESETRSGGIAVITGYDGYGRLTNFTRTGEEDQANIYNGMDERVVVSSGLAGGGMTTRRFVYDTGGRVLGEYGTSASNVIAERIWMTPEVADSGMFGGDDGTGGYAPIAIVTGTTLSWVHANHMGVPQLYTDASGAIIATPNYTLPGFPGQFRTFADLYYNKYRDYDVSTGRYIQADPIGLAGGQSSYSYAMGNPLRYTDPTGEFVPLIPIIGVAILGGLGGALGDLAIQAGVNAWNGRGAFDCINWTQVGAAGAVGALTGGVGGAGFRTAAGLSTKFSNASRRIRRAEGLVGSGKDLHHWLLSRSWEDAFGGRAARIVNGRWNLNPIPEQFHDRLHSSAYNWFRRIGAGSPTWARQAAGLSGASFGAGLIGDGFDNDCSCSN